MTEKPTRIEKDSMGEMSLPADALHGASTHRAVLNFPVSGYRFSRPFIRALGLIKWAAAQANHDLGLLDAQRAALITQVTGRALIGHRDKQALCWLLALAAAFLYPFALGWTRFDPYALGFASVEFITALLLITLASWWARLYLVVIVVVVAALAFLAGAYESRNLWDYLIDPLVSFYAFAWLLVRLPKNVSLSRNSRRAD